MTCARSPSRGFAAHLVLHSPFPAAARPQGRILSIALQQVGDDKHTAGGGGRQQDRVASSGMQWQYGFDFKKELLLLFNTTRTHSGPPSTGATITMDGGVADTAHANTRRINTGR